MISKKLVLVFLTGILLAALLISGGVQALVLGIILSENTVLVGDKTSILVNVDLEDDEITIDKLMFDLNGTVYMPCYFNTDGSYVKNVTSCKGMAVERINETCDGYCSGYVDENKFKFNITINTAGYQVGLYRTEIVLFSGEDAYRQGGESLVIVGNSTPFESCSVRADDGSILLNGVEFGNKVKLNFNIPKRKAVNGEGSLVAQKGNDRLNYKFIIDKTILNNATTTKVLVAGEYRIGRGNEINERAIITLNKAKGTASVEGLDIKAMSLNIKFIKGCE